MGSAKGGICCAKKMRKDLNRNPPLLQQSSAEIESRTVRLTGEVNSNPVTATFPSRLDRGRATSTPSLLRCSEALFAKRLVVEGRPARILIVNGTRTMDLPLRRALGWGRRCLNRRHPTCFGPSVEGLEAGPSPGLRNGTFVCSSESIADRSGRFLGGHRDH